MVYARLLTLAAGLSLLQIGPTSAAPITVTMSGHVSYIQDFTPFLIGADITPAFLNLGDSASATFVFDPALASFDGSNGSTTRYAGTIISMTASVNGGAVEFSFDPTRGIHGNTVFLQKSYGSYFSGVDWDVWGPFGATQGTTIPTSDPMYVGDWKPEQFQLFFDPVADHTFVPSEPHFTALILSWSAPSSCCSFWGSYITILLDDIPNGGHSVPEPATFALFAAGLACMGRLRRRKLT